MSLIAVGTLALDNIKTAAGARCRLLGGSAAHFAMSARLFTKVHLVSIIGKDFPAQYMKFLSRRKVGLESVSEAAGRTFQWNGEYEKGNYNTALTLSTELGVLAGYDPWVAPALRKVPNVFLANCGPDVQSKCLSLMRNPKFVGLDSMNLWIRDKRKDVLKLMKKVDLFVLNDGEAAMLCGETNAVRAARRLRRMGPKLIVIKKGEHGALFYSGRLMFAVPAFPVGRVIDPTGAGDTFAGGLMGYLSATGKMSDASLYKAVIYATALASFNVEGFGASQTAGLTMPMVHARTRGLLRFIHPQMKVGKRR